jgi:hypothetical protein
MGRPDWMPEQQEPESSAPPGPAVHRQTQSQMSEDPVTPQPLTTPQTDLATNQSEAPQRIPYWLQQVERFLRVIVRIYLGLLVCLAPWYPPAWEANPLFLNSPSLIHFISHGAVRGIVSGLGLLNLWIALTDALKPLLEPSGPNSGPDRRL